MSMKCPDCGAQRFFVKDPEDQYNIFEFDVKGGKICYSDKESESDSPEVIEETEIFCDRCAWHDKFKNLK
ncbi:MAG: hypothetical protein KJ630_23980 [Proteobacteria bacterium]|nr:hypothetical protein [Pseudomonadota bacterium]